MRPHSLCPNALFLVLALPFGSPAQVSAQTEEDADARAYRSYVLTMPKYKKYLAVMIGVAKAAERRPAVGDAFEESGELSIQQTVTRFNKVPEIRRAISGAGLTTREFVILQGAIIGTGLAHALMKQNVLTPDSASKMMEVSRRNLDFYGKNEVELNRLMKEAEAKAPKLKKAEEEQETAEAGEDPDTSDQ